VVGLSGVGNEGWLWLGSSLLAAILWTNLIWFLRRPLPGTIGEFVSYLSSWPFSPWLLQLLRLLYYLGVPFAALVWGRDAVVELALGLKRLDLTIVDGRVSAAVAANWESWAQDTGWAVTLGFGAWALLALGWFAYQRALSTAGERDTTVRANYSGWVLLREAAYHEVHWAFYRNAPILALGIYWGVWIGLALVTIEAALNPAWRRELSDPHRAPAHLMRGALAVLSAVLFPMAQNLWLAVVVHWGVSWGLVILLGITSTRRPRQSMLPTSQQR
jgi:hypothetical protein